MAELITLSEIEAAAERGRGVVLHTPMMATHTFSVMSGRQVWMKAENLQRTGSFKIRGAMNAIAQLDDEQRPLGVVAASAGNHAQGVALASSTLGVPATVFMPSTAPLPKLEATKSYGATVMTSGRNIGDAIDAARDFATETGARFIHPYDDKAIVTGQGTLGLEVIEDLPEVGTVVIPVGGGGLIAGAATAIKAHRPNAVIVGVEASATPTYVESRRRGEPTHVEPNFTVADGIAVARPSHLVFEHVETHVDHLVTVEDGQMTSAVALLLERAKFLVEPSGAAPLAAILDGLLPADAPEPTVVVLSGGNVDLLLVDRVVRHGLEATGRFTSFKVQVPDVPGKLAFLTNVVAEHGANVVAVEHHREGIGLPFGFTEIRFDIETRDAEQLNAIMDAIKPHPVEVLR